MNRKSPGDNDAGAADPDPFADPDEPTRMITPEMRPPEAAQDDRSQTSGTNTGTGTFGDLTGLAEQPGQMLQEGDTLKERFVLESRLGTGGMGTVYKALDLRKQEAEDRNPYIAIKILNEDFRSHPESLRTLQRESKKAQSLAHPSIVTVYDFDRDGTSIYMTMEYLEGKPLDKITKSSGFKGLPLEQSLEIVKDVGAALAFAHDQGIVHCDFKPGNIFITDTGPAKVIDFGIARAVKKGDDPHADATVFDAGSLGALTPAYASPEMLEDVEPDPRDDVYALACIAYELISGRHPFGRMPATEARDNGLVPKQPKELNRKQWRNLAEGLAFERSDRTANVETFVEGLVDSGGGRKAIGLVATLAAVAAVAGVAVMGGAGMYFGMFDSEDPKPGTSTKVAESSTEGAGQQTAETGGTDTSAEKAEEQGPSSETAENSAGVGSGASSADEEPAPEASTETPPVQEAVTRPPRFSDLDVETLVMSASCADIHYNVEGSFVALTGYSGSMAEINILQQKIESLSGVENTNINVGTLDGALCAPLDLYAPYVRRNRVNGHGLKVQARNRDGDYVENENLVVDLRLPSFESYVYVDYYSIDGGVLHMLPNQTYPENLGAPDIDVALGDEDSARNWSIAAPFGTEMVVVLTSPQPLFENDREEVEFANRYLPDLRKQLEQVERGSNGSRLSADIFFITTSPAP
ncbi:serine/threonine protein kinase [Pelagibius sp. Alg239-R121]|uniref:serine/threonine protein kinase n=1 Tax=Pelagibius sp. Alg239-R121 TaxID=2993448 RepID=UPI0024A61FEB|nr:protein kinase [Pelagibius sp. Alg239-R121]